MVEMAERYFRSSQCIIIIVSKYNLKFLQFFSSSKSILKDIFSSQIFVMRLVGFWSTDSKNKIILIQTVRRIYGVLVWFLGIGAYICNATQVPYLPSMTVLKVSSINRRNQVAFCND